ncbi:aromatic amino acid transport family protein [Bartonella sp. DGB1]|uniref:aromatic amino acid transport family protein n=1 Tax=Bartonella sp. DGB1 TaxID=3239807 RepID=UPI00352485F1
MQDDSLGLKKLNKYDIHWILSIYGSAIGAGILFLPIESGIGGLLTFVMLLGLAFPTTYLSHKYLSYLILNSKNKNYDIVYGLTHSFGKYLGGFLLFLYFLDVFPLLIIYAVSLINNIDHISTNLLNITTPPVWISLLFITSLLLLLVNIGKDFIAKLISFLVVPLIVFLAIFSLAIIPFWNGAIFTDFSISNINILENNNLVKSSWLTISLMIFSFSYSFIVSPFVSSTKSRYGEFADKKINDILFYASLLIIATALLFVFSCAMILTSTDFALVKEQNINILDYFSQKLDNPILKYTSSIFAFIAIFTSFVGLLLSAKESLANLFLKISSKKYNNPLSTIFLLLFICIISTTNPNILNIIEFIEGPIVAILFFIMPTYALYRIPQLKKYRSAPTDIFLIIIGLLAISTSFSFFT